MAIDDNELTGFLNNKSINQRSKIFLSILSDEAKLNLILFEYKNLSDFKKDLDFHLLIDDVYDFYTTDLKYKDSIIIENNLKCMIEFYKDKQEYEKCSKLKNLISKL